MRATIRVEHRIGVQEAACALLWFWVQEHRFPADKREGEDAVRCAWRQEGVYVYCVSDRLDPVLGDGQTRQGLEEQAIALVTEWWPRMGNPTSRGEQSEG